MHDRKASVRSRDTELGGGTADWLSEGQACMKTGIRCGHDKVAVNKATQTWAPGHAQGGSCMG